MKVRGKRFKNKCVTQVNHLLIIHWNIEGINSQIYGDKTENEYFLNTLTGHDIIAFTETQCNDDTPIHILGYKVCRWTRQKHANATKYSGGIAICIKQELVEPVQEIHSSNNSFCLILLSSHLTSSSLGRTPVHLMLNKLNICLIVNSHDPGVYKTLSHSAMASFNNGLSYDTWCVYFKIKTQEHWCFVDCLTFLIQIRKSRLIASLWWHSDGCDVK